MKKALKALAFAVGYVAAYLVVLLVLLYVADFFDTNFHLPYIDLLAFVLGNALMIGLLIYIRRRTRDKWIRAEAEKRLTERARHANPGAHSWRKRLRRGVLWIPSAVVLTISLFLPETMGVASHLFCGRLVDLAEYRLKTPLTWIVASRSDSSAWVIAGKGIGRVGLRPYWRKEAPVSEMVIYVSSDPAPLSEWYLSHAKLLSKQTLQLGSEKVICLDIVPYAETRQIAMDPQLAEILCSNERYDFHTNFVGRRSDSSAFYELVQSATRTK